MCRVGSFVLAAKICVEGSFVLLFLQRNLCSVVWFYAIVRALKAEGILGLKGYCGVDIFWGKF